MMTKGFASFVLVFIGGLFWALEASESLDRARQLERTGQGVEARALLARAAQEAPNNPAALLEYAEFLDRYGDLAARGTYEKLLAVLTSSGDRTKTMGIARRLIGLDLLAGDRSAAARHLEAYRAGGGKDLAALPVASAPGAAKNEPSILIPGPLRSFSRMAAISSDSTLQEVLPALARNVVTNGYQASHSNDALEQTEYLKLVHRYLSQARELEKLGGQEKIIKIETCDSANTGELLRILGYRIRGGCGSEVVLETVNASRAFLTTDSGFPLQELEQALRTNRPFIYDFKPTVVPVLFAVDYWLSASDRDRGEFIDVFLSDPQLCRLYLGLSKLDQETAEDLRKNVSFPRLRAFSHVLDFFGGMFHIRGGKAVVPGGARSAAAWTELVGGSPDQGAAFLEKLIAKDDGWLASYFDALARVRDPVHTYLTEPARLKRFYTALRGRITSPGPARPVFRSNTDLMLLTTRLQIDSPGTPHIPGTLEIWRNLFVYHPHGKYDGKLTKLASSWKEPDDLLEALFALCRKAVENEPLKIYMALSDLDRNRQKPLEPATVDRLARGHRQFGAQYTIFNEAPSISDKSIMAFMDAADAINRLKDPLYRGDTAGIMQALIGMWQIFTRQGTLPAAQADATFLALLNPFSTVRSDVELFDAGRSGVKVLLEATASKSDSPQDRLVDLLAGVPTSTDTESHTQVVQEMIRILEAQRIVSLNTLFELADHLERVSRGEKVNTALVNRLAARISEIQLPRASLSAAEKNALAFGYWTEKHIESQRKLYLRTQVDKVAGQTERVKELRGLLSPFLRDTLVALNYVHYAPPGAQLLYTNPLFVRSHDFLGVQGSNSTWRTTELFGTGWPSNAGGRLVGSMAGLAYGLAEAEQNFIVPSQTQALIWGDLVPQMILSAKIPRWWNVTPAQMHWMGLHVRYGQRLLADSVLDVNLRKQVIGVLEMQAVPARTMLVEKLLQEGNVEAALDKVTPTEFFVIAKEMSARQGGGEAVPCQAEIRRLASVSPDEVNYERISRAFGTPKPTLATSFRPELLHLRTFPTLMGYSSRIMAESWESNTLYWVALADEVHVRPSQLNVRIPEWTQKLVERIFASHLEDWPAVLRSLRIVGDDIRTNLRSQITVGAASQPSNVISN